MSYKRRRLLYDIETSLSLGYFWSPGYNMTITHDQILLDSEIICISYKWEDEEEVHSLDWRMGQEEMIKKFVTVLNLSDEAIAHNGDRFDIRWVRAEAMKYGIPMSPTTKTVDTLKIAKKYFRLPSYRLDALGKRFFGEGKVRTEYEWWKDLKLDHTLSRFFGNYVDKLEDGEITDSLMELRQRADDQLEKMIEYCEEDVRLLERVFKKLWPYSTNYTHYGVLANGEKYSCPECGSLQMKLSKTRTTAKGTIQRQMLCSECGKYHTISNRQWEELMVYRL